MMFLKIESELIMNVAKKMQQIKFGYFRCDHCGNDFIKRSPKKRIVEMLNHFCNANCAKEASKKGGVIDRKKRENCIQKYGSEHHLQNPEIQQKRLNTCEKLFGGRAPMSSQEIQEKAAITNEKRYGGHFSKNPNIKKKKRETCLKRYGVDSFSKTDEFKKKIDWKDLTKRSFETRKKMGKAKISKIETSFGEFLKSHFGVIENQVEINNWWIDFYIPSIKTYVQFDGDYWHGLDIPLEHLLESDKPQYRVIAGTKIRDTLREQWFSEKGLRLRRVRESAFKKKMYDQILKLIQGEDHGL